jgi:hypothetical protein
MGNPMTMKSIKSIKKINLIKSSIENNSLTNAEIGAITGLDAKSIRNYIRHLRENKEVYISCFKKKGKTYAPCYRSGDKEDVPHSSVWAKPKTESFVEDNWPVRHEWIENWVPRCDWAASWVPVRGRSEKAQD